MVTEVRPEGPGVVSVILTGRDLDRLPVSGGQFMLWRFLTPRMWWQAHPFSLSALPQPPYLRLTVKGVGDFSQSLARLRPGTKVAIEGPYGAFTRYAQRRPKALLIAAGIGVTALRALLEDLPRGSAPVVLLRASAAEDLVLGTEVAEARPAPPGQDPRARRAPGEGRHRPGLAAPARPRPAAAGRVRVRAGGLRGRHRRGRPGSRCPG